MADWEYIEVDDWRLVDDGRGSWRGPMPPDRLRDGDGFLAASEEVAWLNGERPDREVSSGSQDEGAVAVSNGRGQGGDTEEPHTGEW